MNDGFFCDLNTLYMSFLIKNLIFYDLEVFSMIL